MSQINRRVDGCTYVYDICGNSYVCPAADYADLVRTKKEELALNARLLTFRFALSAPLTAEEREALREEIERILALLATVATWEGETLFGAGALIEVERIVSISLDTPESREAGAEEARENAAADVITGSAE